MEWMDQLVEEVYPGEEERHRIQRLAQREATGTLGASTGPSQQDNHEEEEEEEGEDLSIEEQIKRELAGLKSEPRAGDRKRPSGVRKPPSLIGELCPIPPHLF